MKSIGNNSLLSHTGTNKLKWQNELLEKAKNTRETNIMKDVDKEWMKDVGRRDVEI